MFDMEDVGAGYLDAPVAVAAGLRAGTGNTATFRLMKRCFDVAGSVVLMLAMASTALVLLVLNPFLNPGPLFYAQDRMGQDCKAFRAFKFRSMLPAAGVERGPYDALEQNRITPLGRFLRKSRLDELPQAFNVLYGDMSLIGPRPDYYEHACEYLEAVPGYRERHVVKPGISGFAQVEVGYAAGIEAVRRKVQADHYYIRNASFGLDTWIAWRTFVVVITRKGT